MSKIHRVIPVLALMLVVGTAPWAIAQNSGSANSGTAEPGAPQEKPAPDPETITVQVVNRIPQVDRSNLKSYWTDVEGRTKDRWMQSKAAASASGEVKLVGWMHTDGRVTGLAMEQSSGNAALDRAARAAVTGSVPYDAFPYGISVNQVRVRFTFTSNEGDSGPAANGNPAGNGKSPGLSGVKAKPHPSGI